MSANTSPLEVRYPVVPMNEFGDWVKQRAIFWFGSGDGLTKVEKSLPPLSRLILITSDDGQDSLFFSSEDA